MAKKNNAPSLEQLTEKIRMMLETLRSVRGFKIGPPIKNQIAAMADAIRGGDTNDATKAAKEALAAGRNILRAFLWNAVIDRPEKMAYLTREIAARREDKCYHEDIVARMDSKRRKFEEVIRVETDEDFSTRIAAYNEAVVAIEKADEEQKLRDRLNITRDKIRKPSTQKVEVEADRERNQAAAAAQRERIIAEREKVADEIMALVS